MRLSSLMVVTALAAGCGGEGASPGGASGAGGASSGSGGASGAGGGSSGGSCEPSETFTGDATYYDSADGSGACSFDPTPNDLMVAALNAPDWAGSALCGACAAVTGPKGTVTLRIVDLCPECKHGDLDLSPSAFDRIAERSAGRVRITWKLVACHVEGPIAYEFKEGSNQWWTAVQLRNHRYPISELEFQQGNEPFVSVPRESYNYFVQASGMGPGPYRFRVTDRYGHVLEDDGIPFEESGVKSGAHQFPECAP